MRIEQLLDEGAFAAIEEAVRAAERTTSGEIVPVVVERSDPYHEVRLGAAAVLTFLLGGIAIVLAPEIVQYLAVAQMAVFLALAWLLARPPVLQSFLSPRVCEERVARAAARAFHEAGLVETRDRTGILIYVSLLEHRVVVLADRGIDSRVEPGTWDAVVARIIDGIKGDHAEAGLADGIRMCGEILAERFPPRADDTNELPNAPRGAS